MSLDTSIGDVVQEYFMLHRHEDFTKIWKHVVANNVAIPTTTFHIVGLPIPSLQPPKTQSKSFSNMVPIQSFQIIFLCIVKLKMIMKITLLKMSMKSLG